MKISVIMQSYLGEYPNSRKHPEFKFVRAVSSFLSQKHEDKELIIISDGCDKTKELYEQLFSHDARINFAYIAKKQTKKMYETEKRDNMLIKYYRGVPRRIGCSMATGDIITYMDSDDIILPTRLSDLDTAWKEKPEETKWASNPLRYVHKNVFSVPNFENSETDKEKPISLKDYGYDINDQFFLNVAVPITHTFTATTAISHRSNIKAVWKDSIVVTDENKKFISGTSEDNLYFKNLLQDGNGFRQESASYVVCHFRYGFWDV